MNNITGRSSTTITTHLIIINVLMLLAAQVLERKGVDLNSVLGLRYYDAPNYRWWQPFTYMFMHADMWHLLSNMYTCFMFGRLMEQVWGGSRYLVYYLSTGIGAAIVQQLAWRYELGTYVQQILIENPGIQYTYNDLINVGFGYTGGGHFSVNQMVTIGASGAVFGILLAFGMMFPNAVIYLMIPPMPLKAKWLVIGYGAFELFCGVRGFGTGIAHFAHLGGMLFGLILILIWKHHRNVNF